MTILNILKPRKALNKAFLKVKAHRNEIELFKGNLINLLDRINESESEEFHKNLVADFLKNTYYGANHYINTKGRNDLVIHNGSTASGTVGVIIEAKKPGNKAEMLRSDNINVKAFQELVLYYLRERITHKNLEIKYLVVTNIYEWFIFDANLFEKEFAENKGLVKQFIDFEEGRLSGKTTDFFYKQIAEPAITAISHEVTFTWFDIRDYQKPISTRFLDVQFCVVSCYPTYKLFIGRNNKSPKQFIFFNSVCKYLTYREPGVILYRTSNAIYQKTRVRSGFEFNLCPAEI